MKVRIGRLRHRVTLQQPVESRTATGGVSKTWSTVGTVWAAVEPLSGKEFLAISQTQNEYTVRIVIRYRASISETWRVLYRNKSYSIHSVINHDERNHMMTLMCSQGVAEEESLTDETYYVLDGGVYVVDGGIQVVDTA